VDAGGQVVAETRTEFDGYFLFDRVPYGDYRLRIGRASAEAMGLGSETGQTVRIDRQTPSRRIGQLRLDSPARATAVAAR
ncbi:MAG TPA: carboxypeptidase-like regulatory domain-containing protein, partial [Novosphingobium sp.]|nr:carboxypeptidase-like regulatory domain-containing protein [Novosphingobium sp.]